MQRQLQQQFARFALIAALLLALAPGMGRLLAAPANPVGAAVEAVCTKMGLQYISLPMSTHEDPAAPLGKHGAACEYCTLLAGTALLAVVLVLALLRPVVRLGRNAATASPLVQRLRGTLGSRGPPLLA